MSEAGWRADIKSVKFDFLELMSVFGEILLQNSCGANFHLAFAQAPILEHNKINDLAECASPGG